MATFLCAELVGAALLAFWVIVRFPALGPGSLRSAMVFSIAGLVVMKLLGVAAIAVLAFPHGLWIALFACALPGFFAPLLAAAWLLRACASMLPGSGGGPGEPVPLRR